MAGADPVATGLPTIVAATAGSVTVADVALAAARGTGEARTVGGSAVGDGWGAKVDPIVELRLAAVAWPDTSAQPDASTARTITAATVRTTALLGAQHGIPGATAMEFLKQSGP